MNLLDQVLGGESTFISMGSVSKVSSSWAERVTAKKTAEDDDADEEDEDYQDERADASLAASAALEAKKAERDLQATKSKGYDDKIVVGARVVVVDKILY